MKKQIKTTLYGRTNTGAIQTWSIFTDDDALWTESGQQNGKRTVHKPSYSEGKNIGKSNQTTPNDQAIAEATAKWQKKVDSGYTPDVENVDSAKAKFFKCTLAKLYTDRKGWDKKTEQYTGSDKVVFPCLMQAKLDGIRMISTSTGCYSRKGKDLGGSFHIKKLLEPVFKKYPDLILDGEMYNHDYRDEFENLVSLIKKSEDKLTMEQRDKVINTVQYHVYDCPAIDGFTIDDTFQNRMNRLRVLLNDEFPEIQLSVRFVSWWNDVEDHNRVESIYQDYLDAGYEGAMIRYDVPYSCKRTWDLLKVKPFLDDEFSVLSVNEGVGAWSGKAKSVTILLENGEACSAGLRGSESFLEQKLIDREQWVGRKVTVRYQGVTKFNKLRFPVVTKWDRESYE